MELDEEDECGLLVTKHSRASGSPLRGDHCGAGSAEQQGFRDKRGIVQRSQKKVPL